MGCGGADLWLSHRMQWDGMDAKWTAAEVYKRNCMKREITGRERARPENAHSPTGWQR